MDQAIAITGGSTASAVLQTAFWLMVVIALILAMGWVARRYSAFGQRSGTGRMKVIATLPVGNRERVLLVQVGEQHLLLGVTSNMVNTLHVFEPGEDLAAQLNMSAGVAAGSPFQSLLQRVMAQSGRAAGGPLAKHSESNNPGPSEGGELCDRLR